MLAHHCAFTIVFDGYDLSPFALSLTYDLVNIYGYDIAVIKPMLKLDGFGV